MVFTSANDPKRHRPLAEPLDVEHNPDANEFCASAKDYADFDFLYDRNEPAPVVDSVGNPTMSSGHIADVDTEMPKRNSMFIVIIGNFANEFNRVRQLRSLCR